MLTHRQLGRDIDIAGVGHADLVLGEIRLDADPGDEVALMLRVRGQDYEFAVRRSDGTATTAAVADGGTLDSVTTGGFLGLWIGVGGTSNGAPTDTVLHLRRFEYVPI